MSHLSSLHTKPSWLMLGFRLGPDRVRLIASNDLSQVQFEVVADYLRGIDFDLSVLQPAHHLKQVVTAVMWKCFVVEAHSYQDAFHHLFQQWTPEEPPELEAQKAIDI